MQAKCMGCNSRNENKYKVVMEMWVEKSDLIGNMVKRALCCGLF